MVINTGISVNKLNDGHYVTLESFTSTCDVQNVRINLIYPNIGSPLTSVLERVINLNLENCKKILYPKFDGYAFPVLKSLLDSVLKAIPCEQFLNM